MKDTHIRATVPLGDKHATLLLPLNLSPDQWQVVTDALELVRPAVITAQSEDQLAAEARAQLGR